MVVSHTKKNLKIDFFQGGGAVGRDGGAGKEIGNYKIRLEDYPCAKTIPAKSFSISENFSA